MLGPHIQPQLGPVVDSRLIVANTIIQYSTLELEQAIMHELDENPALELVQRISCPICARLLHGSICPFCTYSGQASRESTPLTQDDSPEASRQRLEDELDPLWTVAAPVTLAERLLAHLGLTLDERDREIALHIVGNLDEHGYFTSSLEELAQILQVEVARTQRVLDELQSLDPPGIGARNVAECLLLQLQRLERQGVPVPPATRAIIQEHLEALGHQHFEQIRRALTTSREEVEAAFMFIRTNLHPYPAHHYYENLSDPPHVSPLIGPSILIHRSTTAASGYEVEVVESQRFLVCMNPLYRQLYQQPSQTLSSGEREHVAHFFERARLFISALQRRHQLLQSIASYLVTYQREFLDSGPLHLRPLTQTSVARVLGIHPSTISRAIVGKFVQLPSQDLLPLQRFFAPEKHAQELVRQIILQEATPLSDEQITRRLREEHGMTLSRQMIANYRADLNIPAARQRAVLLRGKRSVE